MKMKAAFRKTYGPPTSLQVATVDKPIPTDDQVLIKVQATTVNRTDCAVLTGKPLVMRLFTGLQRPKRPIPGTDFAGLVEAVGKNVKVYQVNDKVWGFHDEGLASQAEYLCYSENGNMQLMPEDLSYEQAAASLEAAHYAYNFSNKVNIEAGQKILINGATGGIGSALLQLLKHYGTQVTAVCNTKNIALIKSLGADKIFDYTCEDFTKDEERYHFVFDAVGKSTYGKCKHLLKPGGAYISSELGPYGQNLFLPLTTKLLGNKRVVFPLPQEILQSMSFMKELIAAGKFKAVIDRRYALDDIAEAYSYVNTGQKTGNVIINFR